ncbi:hypothetical protein ColLi_11488 [Colletotrichum liriopes]|uniref:Uncharacterized protein n=1 Tax=Colletotrichum liriopes TaxID=708192 RepID=A0AA37GXR2_9PEZI|nr:hypothetical protein ColLi_11488 [Colletotrichum liriopes]
MGYTINSCLFLPLLPVNTTSVYTQTPDDVRHLASPEGFPSRVDGDPTIASAKTRVDFDIVDAAVHTDFDTRPTASIWFMMIQALSTRTSSKDRSSRPEESPRRVQEPNGLRADWLNRDQARQAACPSPPPTPLGAVAAEDPLVARAVFEVADLNPMSFEVLRERLHRPFPCLSMRVLGRSGMVAGGHPVPSEVSGGVDIAQPCPRERNFVDSHFTRSM